MRKWKAIIISDDQVMLSMMRYFFNVRGGYEAQTYREPGFCQAWKSGAACTSEHACADIMITGLTLPKMSGVELFRMQAANGCPISIKNKALVAAQFNDDVMKDFLSLGCAFFEMPIDFSKISTWLSIRERHLNPFQPLSISRREERYPSNATVTCLIPPHNDILHGITVNMSGSGLCLKTDRLLTPEQVVTIHPGFRSRPYPAAVRWAMQAKDGSYLTGIQYT